MMKHFKTVFISGLIILISSAIFISCGKKKEAEEEVVRPVRVMVLENKMGGGHFQYPGTVDAIETVDISFEVDGTLVELPIKRGSVVTKGEMIAKLDPRDFQNNLNSKRAQAVEAKADLDRYRKLYEDDVVPIADLQVKEKQYDVAVAEMKIAQKSLEDATLKAPFDGVIARKFYENYQTVQAKDPIARVQDISKLRVVINVPEQDVVDTRKGEEALASAVAEFDTIPNQQFDLKVYEYETQADPDTQTFQVKFVMPAPETARIMPGMTANVTVTMNASAAGEKGAFLIPVEAVMADPTGKSFVWIIDGTTNTAHKREVTIGDIRGLDAIEVLDGIVPGEMIATAGTRHLTEGMKVLPRAGNEKITR